MEGPGVAIDAAVFAAAIRIDAGFEAHIRAVIVVDDGIGMVFEELRRRNRLIRIAPVRIAFERDLFKPVRRVVRRAAGGRGWRVCFHD